jgi:hypothetical protein
VNGGPGRDTEWAGAVADAARRLELAEALLASRETETGRPLDARYRAFLKAGLADVAASRLEAALEEGGANLGDLARVGDTAADLVFTPVPPCRILDTRVAGGIMVAGTPRNFFVAGAAGFAGQGGTAGGCGIPLGTATAAVVNLVAVSPAGTGNLRAWAVASPQPGPPAASLLNFEPILPALANGIAVPICDTSAGSCPFDMRVQVNASDTHFLADVVGYFARVSEPRTTQILYGGVTNLAPPGASGAIFMRNLGTFTKAVAASVVDVTWHGHVRQTGTPGSTFCQYQLRVDDTLPTGIVSGDGFGVVQFGADAPATLTSRWSGLVAGSHTVSLWLLGTATTCTVNFGGFSQQQVFVVEN